MDTPDHAASTTIRQRPWWRLHGATWAAACLVVASSVYLNLDVVDALYRLKYGPVRPSILISGWPFHAIGEDPVSAELHVNWTVVLTNTVLTLILAAGAAIRLEAWRRKSTASWHFTAEHSIAIFVAGIVVLALDVVHRLDSLIDPIDCAGAFRWPAASILFVALYLTCSAFVDSLRCFAERVTRRKEP